MSIEIKINHQSNEKESLNIQLFNNKDEFLDDQNFNISVNGFWNSLNNSFINNEFSLPPNNNSNQKKFLGRKKLFKVFHPGKYSLFSISESKSIIRKILPKNQKKEERKNRTDNIKTKILNHLWKVVKLLQKIILEKYSKNYFIYFPDYIKNSKKMEKELSNKTIIELLTHDYSDSKKDENNSIEEHIKKNKKVLEYIYNHEKILQDPYVDYFLTIKYSSIFEEYINSHFFRSFLEVLKENESEEYIKNYYILAYFGYTL